LSVSTTPNFAPSPYVFDNDDPDAVDRHNILPAMFDELTTSRLAGLGDLAGLRCLEIGAGGGSVASWLADQTGPTGRVLATDINVRHLRTDAGFEVRQHDIVNEPVPEGPWDVIHARLLLLHLPERREVLHRLVGALAPGGVVLLEEFASTIRKGVLVAPSPEAAALYEAYHSTLLEILPANGNDPTWAENVHATMLDEGLVDVDTLVHARSWPGGTAGALLIAANIGQLRDQFLDAGMTGEDLDALCQLVRDPNFVLRGHLTYSVIGRRPLD
jgi:SAM-dependent methyltransferase